MMTCDPSVVEIMMTAYAPQVKYRLCVGYRISTSLYAMRTFGLIDSQPGLVHPQDTLMRACENTYNGIQTSGEITIPIFGYAWASRASMTTTACRSARGRQLARPRLHAPKNSS